ncbi:uncharacterized protein LOC111338019 [Stylophora pistillata]|uniref:TRADD-like N-terminal domain-containing protein n=1 Tax=Stylophora pistillata TaxID=50429 RepID=A0A2B4RTM9_STYPI|nr:uncharacterized protein LOC111338019 [Stylophora pistillata]PFX19582.1 hypothetical protein AWC38_SpisGene16018 [Stylophora pistillata]
MKYLNTIDPSKPEELNGFVQYLKEVREVLIVETVFGSLIITVECISLEILDGLWNDYRTGYLNEMAQKYLVTKELLIELGLRDVKLTVTILENEYKKCQEYFLQHSDNKNTRPHEKVQEITDESTRVSEKDRHQRDPMRWRAETESWYQLPPQGRHSRPRKGVGKNSPC